MDIMEDLYTTTFSNNEAFFKKAAGEIETLRAQVAELKAENERLQSVVDQSIDDGIDKVMAMSDEQINALAGYEGRSPEDQSTIARQCMDIAMLRVSLTLAQADNQRLREFAQKISEQIPEKPDYWSSCGQCSNNADEAEDLIAQSQDVSALDAIVQKAGEVMRERCIHTCRDYGLVGNAIRALPGVTLEDLK